MFFNFLTICVRVSIAFICERIQAIMACTFALSVADDNLLPSTSLVEACPGSKFFVFMTLINALVRTSEKISGKHERVKPVEKLYDKYDFIVVGGGAGGAVVASRLSEIHNWTVLLLEAGSDEPAGARIPAFAFSFLNVPRNVWNYTTTGEPSACRSTGGACAWPSGKNLGGNTAHNAMIYLRGLPKDYDDWAAQGNEGWEWENLLKYFKKGEKNGEIDRVGTKYHGIDGPLSVERFPFQPPISTAILAASKELNWGVSEDLNGDIKNGFSFVQSTNVKGVRCSSNRAYLQPVRERKNLHVSLESQVTRVLFENKKAVGVEYYKNGEYKTVYATKEIILSAGVIKSAHLLLLSGIGPKEDLESMDVEVILDLPGVGENLHDHPTAPIDFTVDEPDTYDNDVDAFLEYFEYQTGYLSTFGTVPTLGILSTNRTTSDYPDIEIYFKGYIASCASGEVGGLVSSGRRTVTILPSLLRPKSRGTLKLASNNPFDVPKLRANYLNNTEDLAVMVEGMKMILQLIKTKSLSRYNFTLSENPVEACSINEFGSDAYWGCVMQQANFAVYHQVGTCKMGPASDPLAVVDPRLRVYGMKRLRVADGSIMPQVTSSNTQAPIMMIGERAADFIKEDWGMLDSI